MAKDTHAPKPPEWRSWLPDLDLLTAFLAFWFAGAFEDSSSRPAAVRVRSNRR